MPQLEQAAFNTIAKDGPGDRGSASVRATFTNPTTPGNLVLAVNVTTGGLHVPHRISNSGFSLLRSIAVRDLQVTVWYRQNCPSLTSLTVSTDAYRSMQLRLLEYSGVAQSNALDRLVVNNSESKSVATGSTGNTAQADELAVGVIANQYASTVQAGFTGGLTRLFESTSPKSDNSDWERGRVTIHQGIATAVAKFAMSAVLSSSRRWISFLVTFRGASTGPARMTSTTAAPMLRTGGGTGSLTVFGPLRSTDRSLIVPMVSTGGGSARIGPFEYQYRLGGWSGLLIGAGTDYRVEAVDGLEGWQVRTSDDELPRGDGALRGVDLQSARQIMFRVNASGTREQVEAAMELLYRSLIPQRDQDWELVWRHPGRPLRSVYCRPVDLARELTLQQTLVNKQAFALRAADPRHYSALTHQVRIPVSQTREAATTVAAPNQGNGPAYPMIRITGPATGVPVSRVWLVNISTDVTFDVASVLPPGSTLLGDMAARATGAPRSIVTIDGQSKYGSWQHPRQAFAINPGTNELQFYTEPYDPSVVCSVEYRDTWSG